MGSIMPSHGCTHGTVPDHHSTPSPLEAGAKQAKVGCMPVGCTWAAVKRPQSAVRLGARGVVALKGKNATERP